MVCNLQTIKSPNNKKQNIKNKPILDSVFKETGLILNQTYFSILTCQICIIDVIGNQLGIIGNNGYLNGADKDFNFFSAILIKKYSKMYVQPLDKPGRVLPFTLKGKKSAEAKKYSNKCEKNFVKKRQNDFKLLKEYATNLLKPDPFKKSI